MYRFEGGSNLRLQLVTIATLAACGFGATAQNTRKLSIQSKVDQYDLLLSGNTGTVSGKPADLKAFNELMAVVSDPLTADCPAIKGKPEVTVREAGKTRSIYIAQGIVTDGEHCLHVSGEGMYFFPIHRDFLIGLKEDHIPLKSPIALTRQGVKLFELKKSGDTWNAEGTTLLLDWDFLERFQNSLKSFGVRFRAQPQVAKGKEKLVVQTNGESFEFYKITNLVWALKRPGQRWLEASDDWGFWYNFDNAVLEDRFTSQIHELEKPGMTADEKHAVLEKLGPNYTRNLHELYAKMVLAADEDTTVKRVVIGRLKTKPTKSTALQMARYLEVGGSSKDDEDFKRIATQILKAQNPKGPLYAPSLSMDEKAKVVTYWSSWAQKNQTP